MKIALITGAAKNIGEEIAIYLKQHGWHIVIHYNNSAREAKRLASRIGADLVRADLSNSAHVQRLFSQLSQPVDLLINNAALLVKDKLDENFESDFLNTMAVNFLAPVKLSFEFIKKFGKGNVINIVDASLSELPLSFLSYIISKQSLETFTKLTKDVDSKVRINAIALGATMIKDNQSQAVFEKIKSKYSSSIEDVCQAIDFILSNRALNGEVLDLTKWKSNL